MKLKVTVTAYKEKKDEIARNNKAKLVLENRLVSLPDPLSLMDRFTAPYNWTIAIFEQVNPLTTNVPHHIETSQLICTANHLTGFYMMGNIGR